MRRVAAIVPEDVDIINAHEWPASRAGRLAARALAVPLVWTRNDDTTFERGLIPETTLSEQPRLLGRLPRIAAGLPDVLDARASAEIVVLDSRNADAVQRAYRRSAQILRCGPAASFFERSDRVRTRERLGVTPGVFLVVAVGILFPHRRFEDLVRAVEDLPADSAIEVRIVGSDHADPEYADMLERLITEGSVGDRARLVRREISELQLRDLYTAADVTVFPNRRQAYGLAPLESLASGTPVILSTGIGVKEILEGRPGVFMVPPERPAALRDAVLAVMAMKGRRGAAAQTREWIRTSLSSRSYAEGMVGIYLKAQADRGRTAA
jgi:glycosyltransferase involved in cell wall biosynthesis